MYNPREFYSCAASTTSAHLCNQVVMNFDVNGYDTRGTDSMNVYLPKFRKDIYKNSFFYKGQVWSYLSDVVKDSPNLEAFKYYYNSPL